MPTTERTPIAITRPRTATTPAPEIADIETVVDAHPLPRDPMMAQLEPLRAALADRFAMSIDVIYSGRLSEVSILANLKDSADRQWAATFLLKDPP